MASELNAAGAGWDLLLTDGELDTIPPELGPRVWRELDYLASLGEQLEVTPTGPFLEPAHTPEAVLGILPRVLPGLGLGPIRKVSPESLQLKTVPGRVY